VQYWRDGPPQAMTSFLVDPILVTRPDASASISDKQAWLVALEGWALELMDSPHHWWHIEACTVTLYSSEKVPDYTYLRSLRNEVDLDINVNVINKIVNRFFGSPEHDIYNGLSTKFVVHSLSGLSVQPIELVDRNFEATRNHLLSLLYCLCCDKHGGSEPATSMRIVTIPLVIPASVLTVSARIELVESSISSLHNVPFDVIESFDIMFTPDDLVGILDARQLFQQETRHIVTEIERLARGQPAAACLPVALGSQFRQSLAASSIINDDSALAKLIRVCAAVTNVTAKDLKLDLRPLRTSPAAGSPQRIRGVDGATAWRLTITDSGVGWRLPYWHVRADQSERREIIEFANVLKKHDPELIPE
jgi:hypothetical protein